MAYLRSFILAAGLVSVAACTSDTGPAAGVSPALDADVRQVLTNVGVAAAFSEACSGDVEMIGSNEAVTVSIIADLAEEGYSLEQIEAAMRPYTHNNGHRIEELVVEGFVETLTTNNVDSPDDICRLARRFASRSTGIGAYLTRA